MKKRKAVLALIIALTGLLISSFGMQVAYGQVPDFVRLDEQLHALIKEKSTPDALLLEAISRLGKVTESPAFWTQIANDPSYSSQHRRRAVFALFRRHAEKIGELHLLGEILKPAKWLQESSIVKLPFVFGAVPVDVNPNESIVCISVLYGGDIYIRILGNVEESAVREVLLGKEVKEVSFVVMQFGYVDGYDEWLRSPAPRQK